MNRYCPLFSPLSAHRSADEFHANVGETVRKVETVHHAFQDVGVLREHGDREILINEVGSGPPGTLAKICVYPKATALTSPVAEIIATPLLREPQVAVEATSLVDPSDIVARPDTVNTVARESPKSAKTCPFGVQ